MNKNGFTLIEVLATIIIIAIIMSLVFPAALRVSKNNKTKIYGEYEKMMVEYAKVSPLRNRDVINLLELEELDKVKRECIGYVTISHSENNTTYTAYISCGEQYETEGFDPSYTSE